MGVASAWAAARTGWRSAPAACVACVEPRMKVPRGDAEGEGEGEGEGERGEE